MKSLGREMGRTGTTANSIALGLIESAHDRSWVDANYDKLVKAYPIRRLGQPSDVAPMVALLASDAGSWITGQVISISGGFSMGWMGGGKKVTYPADRAAIWIAFTGSKARARQKPVMGW